MSQPPSLRDRLELAVITYNRSGPLERTLEQLHASPFAECRITVLDNASTDDTPDVCARWQPRFSDLHVVRHPRNVGLSPNYLRAVELSRSEYTWVLSDDEEYDWSVVDDVVEVLLEGEVDLLMIGSPHQADWERGLRTTVADLVARGAKYHSEFTFIAGSLFRTELFDSLHVSRGYRNSDNLYPHFAFVHDQIARGSTVYVGRHAVVRRTERDVLETVGADMSWLIGWVRSCEYIDDPEVRKAAIYEAVGDRRQFLWRVAVNVALERLRRQPRLWHELSDLIVLCPGELRLTVLACAPLALVPAPVYAAARWVASRLRGAPVAPDAAFDELRM